MTTATAASTIDTRTLRRALGNFATGITVITAQHEGVRAGVTANSFSSVSLDPPLVLWCLDKRSGSARLFQQASHFAINILAVDQIGLSKRFAGGQEDRFAELALQEGLGGCLLLEHTSASFQCARHQILDGGDHWILLGRVEVFEDHGRAPLVYHQGVYSLVQPHPAPSSPSQYPAKHVAARRREDPRRPGAQQPRQRQALKEALSSLMATART
ncbi:flavin reductase family protein [Castellaniella caeni]